MKRLSLSLGALGIVALALALALTGCETKAGTGALVGGGVGAGAGALIGSTTGHAGGGALIGGAIGAASGAVIGDQADQRDRRQGPPRERGHYENRIVQTPSGDTHEERVWVPDR